jgi:hypothetical protein
MGSRLADSMSIECIYEEEMETIQVNVNKKFPKMGGI